MTTRNMGKGAGAEQLGLDVASGETVDVSGYRCIVSDPPWQEKGGSRGADKHYPLLPTPEILRVMLQAPVWRPARNAHHWMWATANFLKDAIWLLEALGFRYVTGGVWVKPSIGIGQYIRLRQEHLLLGVRGRQHTRDNGVDSVIEAPRVRGADGRVRHSAKPDEAYRRIERVSPGPRLEMFARLPRPGWDVWGNEVGAAAEGAEQGAA